MTYCYAGINGKKIELRLLCYLIYFLLTILFYHASFSFFLIIDLNILIAVFITQSFNPTAELVIPVGIPTKEAKVISSSNCRN